MRLAGTASQYSKKAMPQLASTTTHSAAPGYLRCPYQAKVMNRLDAMSSPTGASMAKLKPKASSTTRQGRAHPGRVLQPSPPRRKRARVSAAGPGRLLERKDFVADMVELLAHQRLRVVQAAIVEIGAHFLGEELHQHFGREG